MASTSSSKTTYDVFLSFRGTDTRQNFTSHLYAALCRKHIKTFMDDNLVRGEEISQTLLKTIEESKISVIILSENYGYSRWCLDELVKIMDCRKTIGRKVLPVFYHVNPCDVRHQIGNFGKAFGKIKEKFKESRDKVQRWSTALTEAANLSGLESSYYRLESKLSEAVVDQIMKKLYPVSFRTSTDLVGIDSHINQILSMLCLGSTDVRFIGIWGMGGIGKTTIAEALVSQISDQFDDCCFFSNVREQSEKHEIVHLRKCFFSKLLQDENLSIEMFHVLPTFVLDMLSEKKVVIVLDDVNDSNQLEALAGSHGWFGPGSRVIVTSRDKQVLNDRVDKIYRVDGLKYSDALKLLSMKAFKQQHPPNDYLELSERVVNYAKGVPLALKVLGSHLYQRSQKEWEGALNKLKQFPDSNIKKILEVSYNELDLMEKNIFLDIACFFKGKDKDWVEDILDGCGFPASWGIIRLVDKCLVTVIDNILEMHDLIQEMGQNVAQQQGSRLWNPKDILLMLTTNVGTKKVEGIFLDMSKMGKVHLSYAAFSQMHNLRLLKFYKSWYQSRNKDTCFIFELDESNLSHPLLHLPNKLSLLYWEEYPCKSLPSNFFMENLVELDLRWSKVEQLWNGHQFPAQLKYLYLSRAVQLTRLPDLSSATNLKWMDLACCYSLLEIPSSIQCLHNLSLLNLYGCKKLRSLPSLIELKSLWFLGLALCTNLKILPEIPKGIKRLELKDSGLEEWPPSVQTLDNLEYLEITRCENFRSLPSPMHLNSIKELNLACCSKFKKFPEITGNPEKIVLNQTSIKELTPNIGSLSSLVELKLLNCKMLKSLPSSICELMCLEKLFLTGCSKLGKLPPLHGLCSLIELHLCGTALVEVPTDIITLSSLRGLNLNYCTRLQGLPELPCQLEKLHVASCSSLETTRPTSSIGAIKRGCYYEFDYSNCVNLDQNARCNIMADAQLRVRELAIANTKRDIFGTVVVGLAGSEIPKWFNYESPSSSVTIPIPPSCFDTMFEGFAFSVVLEFKTPLILKDDFSLRFKCHFKITNGNQAVAFGCNFNPVDVLESDHMFFWYDSNSAYAAKWLIRNCCNVNEASFYFEAIYTFPGDDDDNNNVQLKVKRSGVNVVSARLEQNGSYPSSVITKLLQSEASNPPVKKKKKKKKKKKASNPDFPKQVESETTDDLEDHLSISLYGGSYRSRLITELLQSEASNPSVKKKKKKKKKQAIQIFRNK